MKLTAMDLNEFRELGLLQEVNRLFFHPMGLALGVVVESDGRVSGFGGVWDCREDPEGITFDGDELDPAMAERVAAMREAKRATREATFGYHVQPLPAPPVETT